MILIDLKRIYKEKNDAFDKYEIIKSDLKKLYNMPDSYEDATFWHVFVIAAALAIAIALVAAPFAGGKDGLKIHSYAICGTIIFFFISAYMLRGSASGVWLLKTTIIVGGCYALVYLAAVNNFPELIRSIKGESFIGIWLACSLVVYIVVLIIQLYVCQRMAVKSFIKLQKQPFSDEELMFISGYSRFRVMGYYLIKAKGDGIIKFTHCQTKSNAKSVLKVSLNDSVKEKAIQNYSAENPEMEHFLHFLLKQKKLGNEDVMLEGVIHKSKAEWKLDGKSISALMLDYCKAEGFNSIMKYIGVGLAYYPGITKLLMGMNNDKPVENLVLFGFTVSLLMTFIYFLIANVLVAYTYEEDVLKKLLAHNEYFTEDFEMELQNILTAESAVTPKYYEDLLRSYASNARNVSRINITHSSEKQQTYEFLNTILEAEKREAEIVEAIEAAKRANQRKNSGGYYGCSSCGGGCGGGGCGGCGD